MTPPATTAQLDLIDGLTFDPFGNLIGALEIPGPRGGLVLVDAETGEVLGLGGGISRADQVALLSVVRAPAHLVVGFLATSEVTPAASSQRLFATRIVYDADGRPQAVTPPFSVDTPLAINNPEGLAVIESDGPFGAAGTVYVAEDVVGGRVLRLELEPRAISVLATGLRRPEGLAFGDFGGEAEPALYAAETALHRVVRIDAGGGVAALGDPAAVGLTFPDNVEFGPDGFLYITEDRPAPHSRIVRAAVDGTHEVFATGFGQAAGLAFHPETGDLYVSEQDFDRIWRVRFTRKVAVDVRPSSPRNRIRPGSPGLIPVAILGAEDLDAHEIDATSLAFGPDGAPVAHDPGPLVDLDADGTADLLLHFRVDDSGIAPGDAEVCLEGALLDGRPLRGCDVIETVPPRVPHPAHGVGGAGDHV